jgi:DNA-binding transcriptional MerR regulator
VTEPWTLSELVEEGTALIAQLPPPKNGQVRAVPDERTVRYYLTIGLLDRAVATRGRTSLFGKRHLAQVVAIKRLQTTGKSLAEIQALWPTMDDETLARMSGVALDPKPRATRKDFWRREPTIADLAPPPTPTTRSPLAPPDDHRGRAEPGPRNDHRQPPPLDHRVSPVELRIELAPDVTLTVSLADTGFDTTDLGAIRAAAAPLLAELARRRRTANDPKETR